MPPVRPSFMGLRAPSKLSRNTSDVDERGETATGSSAAYAEEASEKPGCGARRTASSVAASASVDVNVTCGGKEQQNSEKAADQRH